MCSTDITYSSDKSATGGLDFGTTSTLVTLPTGTTLASFDVDIVNDIVVEDFEEFCVFLDNVRAPDLIRTDAINHADTTATVSITDEDTGTAESLATSLVACNIACGGAGCLNYFSVDCAIQLLDFCIATICLGQTCVSSNTAWPVTEQLMQYALFGGKK